MGTAQAPAVKNELFTNPFNMFRLATLVLADYDPIGRADAAYLFGHTPDQERSILETGARIYLNEEVNQLFLCGGGPYWMPGAPPGSPCAYNGAPAWRDWLVGQGVRDEDIIDIPRPDGLSHTGTEAHRFALYAKEHGFETAYIVGWPAHMLRCFANMVAAADRFHPSLLVHCKPGTPLPWSEEVVSSQATVVGNRFGTVMEGEWARLNVLYGNDDDLVDADALVAYIERRPQLVAQITGAR